MESAGTTFRLVYLPIDEDTQRARIARRQQDTPEQTFPMSDEDIKRWRAQFEVPDAAELGYGDIGAPPEGWPSWRHWVAAWWPSSFPDGSGDGVTSRA